MIYQILLKILLQDGSEQTTINDRTNLPDGSAIPNQPENNNYILDGEPNRRCWSSNRRRPNQPENNNHGEYGIPDIQTAAGGGGD